MFTVSCTLSFHCSFIVNIVAFFCYLKRHVESSDRERVRPLLDLVNYRSMYFYEIAINLAVMIIHQLGFWLN